MELRHLRYFTAIADYGSLTAAARRLHVSQSSISEQMFDLEAELGGALLDRTSRSIRLTAQGQVFLEEARKTLEGSPSVAELKASQEKLTTASHKMAELLYKANSAAGANPAEGQAATGEPAAEAKKDEGVIDAEYVDVEEKK